MVDEVSRGFFDRMKKINAIRLLGTGMDLGVLQPYAHEICFHLLLKIFRREITDNINRTRNDIIVMADNTLKEMKLEAELAVVERLVDGILWYQKPDMQDPFTCQIYNEESEEHEEFRFRYLIIDREASDLERASSRIVYMLTDIAHEMIFITREILEEFGFDLEQFYTLQLIKSGNFNEARSSVGNLIARVRTLIKRQRDLQQDILRNPQVIFVNRQKKNKRSEEEIREQFADEKKVFEDMFSWRDRLANFPEEKRQEGEQVFEELEQARMLHDELARLVIENMALEVRIRVEHPDSFWQTSRLTFRKDFWQNIVVKNGLPQFELLERLLTPLFSPEIEFVYPLDWAWEEQSIFTVEQVIEEQRELIEEEERDIIPVDWDLIIELWKPVFDCLIEEGSFAINNLQDLTEKEQQKWLSQPKNMELFMMFAITEITLLEVDEFYDEIDERILLFSRLCQSDQKYRQLTAKRIASYIENNGKPLYWNELFISPYRIYVTG